VALRPLYLIFRQLVAWFGLLAHKFTIEECGNPRAAPRGCAAARVFSSASSGPRRVLPAAAAPVMNASVIGPSAQNACSASAAAWPATLANLFTLADRLPEGAA
jgi:hypothetical protein